MTVYGFVCVRPVRECPELYPRVGIRQKKQEKVRTGAWQLPSWQFRTKLNGRVVTNYELLGEHAWWQDGEGRGRAGGRGETKPYEGLDGGGRGRMGAGDVPARLWLAVVRLGPQSEKRVLGRARLLCRVVRL